MSAIFNISGGPFASGTTPVLSMQLVDVNNNPVLPIQINSITLSLADTLTKTIINGVSQVDVFNSGRGTYDSGGNLTITLEIGDTLMTETTADQVQRSAIIDWTYNSSQSVGRVQVNFIITSLVAP